MTEWMGTLGHWFLALSLGALAAEAASPVCQVRGGEGVFSYRKMAKEGPAHCGGTVIAAETEGEKCWLGFLTSAHCLVKTENKKILWKIRRGDRLQTRLGPLRVRDLNVNTQYLDRIQKGGTGFHPMSDLALVIAQGGYCPKAVPMLSAQTCKKPSRPVPFLLACPGKHESIRLEPIYAAGSYSDKVLNGLGLSPGTKAPWRGYSHSKRGCSGGPWLKYHQENDCTYQLDGICAVHAGHAKTRGDLRESRGTPLTPSTLPWRNWCASLARWGLTCPLVLNPIAE